jgi:hypothetical protein
VQSFFLRVFEQASRKPNVRNLKPIYYMLTGACRGFLSLLPFNARQHFDEQLCHILKAKLAPQDCMLLLWCFGIAIIGEQWVSSKHTETLLLINRVYQVQSSSTVHEGLKIALKMVQ